MKGWLVNTIRISANINHNPASKKCNNMRLYPHLSHSVNRYHQIKAEANQQQKTPVKMQSSCKSFDVNLRFGVFLNFVVFTA